MTDLRTAAEPKTDQLNFDMLLGGATLTIKVTEVTVSLTGEQRVVIHYEGENGRPYKPCKSMIRVLIGVWGADGKQYVGRSMTLYGDPKVVFGGMTVGGIRISHMSHIAAPQTIALTVTRSKRAPFTVKPLVISGAQATGPAKLTREQQSTIAEAAKQAGITGADVFAKFNVDRLSNILSSAYGEVLAWVEAQGQSATCPECTCELVDGHCYNEMCPNGEPPPDEI